MHGRVHQPAIVKPASHLWALGVPHSGTSTSCRTDSRTGDSRRLTTPAQSPWYLTDGTTRDASDGEQPRHTGLQPEGEIELEYTVCSRASFPAGAVMFFDSLSLRTLRNRRRHPAVLTFLTRTRATRSNRSTPTSK